jgi:hypothetical protein
VQQRSEAWLSLMRSMMQHGASSHGLGDDAQAGARFVYLRHAWPHQLPFNPLDLEVSGLVCARLGSSQTARPGRPEG